MELFLHTEQEPEFGDSSSTLIRNLFGLHPFESPLRGVQSGLGDFR
jgi:hypothetical protein